MNRMLFGLFLLGIVVTICGWFFDRALDIRWVSRLISPAYHHGNAVLDQLEDDSNLGITADERGCIELLRRWPGLADVESVHAISRSVAFMQFGSVVASDIELIARAGDMSEVPPRWAMTAARKSLGDQAKNRAFWLGAVVFFLGLFISFVAGTLQYLEGERQEGNAAQQASQVFTVPSN